MVSKIMFIINNIWGRYTMYYDVYKMFALHSLKYRL